MTDHISNGEKLVEMSDAELCVETFGNPANPAVLLVDGAAASTYTFTDLAGDALGVLDAPGRGAVFVPALIQHTGGGRS